MAGIDYLEYFPKSLFNTDSTTNLYKLWKLRAIQIDELWTQIELYKTLLVISTQTGINLDRIGSNINCPRAGAETDADYRISLYTAIAARVSGGTIGSILDIASIIINYETWAHTEITEVQPAGIQVYTNVPELLENSNAILEAVKAAGVNLISVSYGDNPFGFGGIVTAEEDDTILGFAEYDDDEDANAGKLSEGYQ